MFEPQNEMGVVYEFARQAHLSGWELVEIGAEFPDAILSMKGEQWVAEFEYAAATFNRHGHDMREVDVIVCWVNDYPDCPIPVIALSESGWMFTNLFRVDALVKEVEYWKARALRAERRLIVVQKDRGFSDRATTERARAVAELSERNIKQQDIAEQLGISRRTVQMDLQSVRAASLATNGKEHA